MFHDDIGSYMWVLVPLSGFLLCMALQQEQNAPMLIVLARVQVVIRGARGWADPWWGGKLPNHWMKTGDINRIVWEVSLFALSTVP